MPAMSVIIEVQPATADITVPAAIGPRLVSTPTQRPFSILRPVTSTPWWMCTPPASALRA